MAEEIEQLRRQRWTGKQIAAETGVSPATVSRVLRRLGLNKLSALEPAEPVRRYEREKPGELIHLDIKKLGRIGSVGHRITGRYPGAVNRHHGIGWEFVHVCIDDASRIAFVQVLTDQRKESAVAFLEAAVAHFAKLGVRIERVMTDNGSCYQSKSFASRNFVLCIREHGDKAKSVWTHLDDSASAWSSLFGTAFPPTRQPRFGGAFLAPALPKLNRPSEAPIRLTRVTAGF